MPHPGAAQTANRPLRGFCVGRRADRGFRAFLPTAWTGDPVGLVGVELIPARAFLRVKVREGFERRLTGRRVEDGHGLEHAPMIPSSTGSGRGFANIDGSGAGGMPFWDARTPRRDSQAPARGTRPRTPVSPASHASAPWPHRRLHADTVGTDTPWQGVGSGGSGPPRYGVDARRADRQEWRASLGVLLGVVLSLQPCVLGFCGFGA